MSFAKVIRPHVTEELRRAHTAQADGKPAVAFGHLERAHVLGQASTREHVRVHWEMLLWGLSQRNPREVAGQIFRLVGAATKTSFGMVPAGNTGGSNVSPFEPLPISSDLGSLIEQAKGQHGR